MDTQKVAHVGAYRPGPTRAMPGLLMNLVSLTFKSFGVIHNAMENCLLAMRMHAQASVIFYRRQCLCMLLLVEAQGVPLCEKHPPLQLCGSNWHKCRSKGHFVSICGTLCAPSARFQLACGQMEQARHSRSVYLCTHLGFPIATCASHKTSSTS